MLNSTLGKFKSALVRVCNTHCGSKTSITGFDLTAVYELISTQLQHCSHKAVYKVCQRCTCSVASCSIAAQRTVVLVK